MTETPTLRYVLKSGFHESVYIVDSTTDSCTISFFPVPGQSAQARLALGQQVTDFLNAGEAERLKDQLLEYYSRWLKAASPHDLLKEAQARLPAPETV